MPHSGAKSLGEPRLAACSEVVLNYPKILMPCIHLRMFPAVFVSRRNEVNNRVSLVTKSQSYIRYMVTGRQTAHLFVVGRIGRMVWFADPLSAIRVICE